MLLALNRALDEIADSIKKSDGCKRLLVLSLARPRRLVATRAFNTLNSRWIPTPVDIMRYASYVKVIFMIVKAHVQDHIVPQIGVVHLNPLNLIFSINDDDKIVIKAKSREHFLNDLK